MRKVSTLLIYGKKKTFGSVEMSFVCYYHGCYFRIRPRILKVKSAKSTESIVNSVELVDRRLQILERVDDELKKGNERGALSLVKQLQEKPGGLRCFGAARQASYKLASCCLNLKFLSQAPHGFNDNCTFICIYYSSMFSI